MEEEVEESQEHLPETAETNVRDMSEEQREPLQISAAVSQTTAYSDADSILKNQ